jgi:hypothetical protein
MKKPTNKPPSITAAAKLAIANAGHTAKRLRADLMSLNVALTVEGNDTAAERMAHGHLLPILQTFATVQDSIAALHNACQ